MPDSLSLKVPRTFSAKDTLSMNLPNMDPTCYTIQPALVQQNANATSISTTGGDGTLGDLVLTISRNAYQALSLGNVNQPPPAAPPAAPSFPQTQQARRFMRHAVPLTIQYLASNFTTL